MVAGPPARLTGEDMATTVDDTASPPGLATRSLWQRQLNHYPDRQDAADHEQRAEVELAPLRSG